MVFLFLLVIVAIIAFRLTTGEDRKQLLQKALVILREAAVIAREEYARLEPFRAALRGRTLYAIVAPGQGQIGLYKSTDAGAHWAHVDSGPKPATGLQQDARPMGRIGGGDLPTVTIDPKDPNVAYTASTVMWRTLDGGAEVGSALALASARL